MYTPTQVSEMLSIPPSSLRRLASEFSDMLSPQRSRHRRYTESDIALLQRIREMTGHGSSLEEIRQALTLVSETPEREQAPGDTLALVPTIAGELERMDSAYREVMSELERLRAEHEQDRERLEQLEALRAWAALPWWRRFFTSPPE